MHILFTYPRTPDCTPSTANKKQTLTLVNQWCSDNRTRIERTDQRGDYLRVWLAEPKWYTHWALTWHWQDYLLVDDDEHYAPTVEARVKTLPRTNQHC